MKINLKEIIASYELDCGKLAEQLFPANKYPKLALNRVLDEESNLDEVQISKLAVIAGCTIDELYSTKRWKASSAEGVHTFESEDYKAILDTNSWVTKIYHKNSLMHTSIIHSQSIALSDYISELNLIIQKYKDNETREN